MKISKTVVVTGGTRGIGRAICEKFAKNGYNVACIYEKSEKDAYELQSGFENVKTYKCDISKYEQVIQISKQIICDFQSIDVIVNNAGISKYQLFSSATKQDFEQVFDVNVKGTFNVTHAFIKEMISKQSGVIINISSMWGQVGASMEVLYSSSKGAIIAFTKALAKEMGLSNIRVNCVSAGVIKTDMLEDFDDETLEVLKDETPLNRLGTPEDIANTVYYLSTDEASFITGQVISVNGGYIV